jgi:hypothetical protein
MPLAAKNNALIIKDGSLAENCGCCGEWYCCADIRCTIESIQRISLTIDSQDYLKWSSWPAPSAGYTATKLTQGVRGSVYAGAISLTPTGPADDAGTREYRYTFPANSQTQCNDFIFIRLGTAQSTLQWNYSGIVYVDQSPDNAQHRELSQLTCPYYESLPYIRASGQTFFVQDVVEFAPCPDYTWPAGRNIVGQFSLSSMFVTIPPTATVERETGSRSYAVRDITFVT